MIRSTTRLAAGLLGLLLVAAPAAAADNVKLTLAATDPVYAPYLIAIERGFYREEGIEVEIVNAGGGTATPALISGSVHFSTSGASAVSAALKGAPLKVIMTAADRLPYKLWSTKPEIKTLADLAGKAVGIQSRGDTFEVALRQLFIMNKLDPNSLIFTPLGYGRTQRMAVIESGSLPAVIISNLDEVALRANKIQFKGNLLVDIFQAVRIPYNGLAVADDLLRKNPDLVRRFLRATMKGTVFMRAKADDTVTILAKYNPKTPRELLRDGLVETQDSLAVDGMVSEAAQIAEIQIRSQILAIPADKIKSPAAVFDYGPLKKVVEELKASGWKP